MTFNDRSTPLSLLATRRSGKARDMVAPGPTDGQLTAMLIVASRVPDHGKLAPWRFVTIAPDRREALADLFVAALEAEKPDAKRDEAKALREFAHQAPALVIVLSRPIQPHKIELWEQELSAGAACALLCAAASAIGFVANWLTTWPAYSSMVAAALGQPGDRIAGFLFIGTPGRELEERPRPGLEDIVTAW